MLTWSDATSTLTPHEWLKHASAHEGSWWPAWQGWLRAHRAARQEPARTVAVGRDASGDLGNAPGSYVRE